MGLTTYTCSECGTKRPVIEEAEATPTDRDSETTAIVPDNTVDTLTLDCPSSCCGTETFVHPKA